MTPPDEGTFFCSFTIRFVFHLLQMYHLQLVIQVLRILRILILEPVSEVVPTFLRDSFIISLAAPLSYLRNLVDSRDTCHRYGIRNRYGFSLRLAFTSMFCTKSPNQLLG